MIFPFYLYDKTGFSRNPVLDPSVLGGKYYLNLIYRTPNRISP